MVVAVIFRGRLYLPRRTAGGAAAVTGAGHRLPSGEVGRTVEPELLDQLPPGDPGAIRSRWDLRRINAWMGNAGIIADLLQQCRQAHVIRTMVEIGSGDGMQMLRVARRLGEDWRGVAVELIDRERLLASATEAAFNAAGWKVQAVQADVFDWLGRARPVDVIVANLFLHHFEDERLAELLERASRLTSALVACEPHRFRFAWAAGRLVILLGCGPVTRHDAIASVKAGFRGGELTAKWPASDWRVTEGRAGLFSHRFGAWRSGGG
jgi:hypothetical protein